MSRHVSTLFLLFSLTLICAYPVFASYVNSNSKVEDLDSIHHSFHIMSPTPDTPANGAIPPPTVNTTFPNGGGTVPKRPWSANFPGYVRLGSTKIYPGPQYISSPILLALILGLCLLFGLYIAISCLMAIQRPIRMSTQTLILSKEY